MISLSDINKNQDSPTFNEELIKNGKINLKSLSYKPSQTLEDASKWAKNNLNINHVDYSFFDLKVANALNKQLEILMKLYPEVNTINWIDELRKSMKLYRKALIKEALHIFKKIDISPYREVIRIILENRYSRDMQAASGSEVTEYRGIWFNKMWVKDYEKLQQETIENVKFKHSPENTSCIESIFTHEFGHQIEDILYDNKLYGFINNLCEEYYDDRTQKTTIRSCRTIEKELSFYASYSKSEFFAEGFKEYIHNPNPRPLAKRIGNELEKAFEIYRLKKR
jgi:hypothetical protein